MRALTSLDFGPDSLPGCTITLIKQIFISARMDGMNRTTSSPKSTNRFQVRAKLLPYLVLFFQSTSQMKCQLSHGTLSVLEQDQQFNSYVLPSGPDVPLNANLGVIHFSPDGN